MSSVEEDIQYLIELVRKDLLIEKLKNILHRNPVKIKEIVEKILVLEEALNEKDELLKKMEKEERHLNSVIEEDSDKIQRKKIEENSIKTNAAYQAWEHEIQYLATKVEMHEERMFGVLEEIEKGKKELSLFSDDVEVRKKKLMLEKNELEKDIKNSNKRLNIVEDEKLRILPHLSEKVRKKYQKILNAKGDSAIANLSGDICQGCFSRMPPQKAYQVRENNKIIACEFCGRILVYYPENEKVENHE
jgi:predicted  nucleic acid-binding Zn-ribbon protein